MSERSEQPAALKRRIERLEALLATETERADKAWQAYRDTLHECVDLKLRLDRIQAEVNGE
jgi:hypothetical protein